MKNLLLKTILRTFLILGFVFAGSFFLAQLTPASAAEYYVAGDTGLDTNPGTSSQPWKTIQRAADVMVAGDTVNVKGGVVYTEEVICSTPWGTYKTVVCLQSNSGTVSNPITFKSWDGTGVPIIDPSVANVGNGIVMYRRNHIHIDGFHIKGAHFVSNNPAGVLIMRDAEGVVFRNNIFSNSQRAFFIDLFEGGVLIVNNTFYDIYGSAIYFYSDEGLTIFANNIIINSKKAINLNSAYMSEFFIKSYNIYYDNETNYFNTVISSTEIHADPLFVDPANGDFRLQPNSPAINAGADVSAYGVTKDILGRARPNAGAFDIGAYEDPNIYVAGDIEVSGNGSMGSPFKTIQEAADVTTPGDVVNVKGGIVYADIGRTTCTIDSGNNSAVLCIEISGTSTNPIHYKAWPGYGIPIIDARYVNRGISPKVGFVIIEGFHIKRPSSSLSIASNVGCIRNSGVISNKISIINNIFENCRETPLSIFNFGETNIINNTIIYTEEPNYAPWITMFSIAGGNIKGNVFQTNLYSLGIALSNTGINFSNNYFYSENATYPDLPGNAVNTNPLFINIANGDFRLQPNSPAINAGADVSAYGVTTDILGVPRPQGSAFDIGAFEYYAVPVSIASPTGAYVTTTSTTVTGVATTTSTAKITNVEYSLDNGAWTNASGNFSFTLNNLSQGSHTVRVRATDSYGNQTHESQYATKTFIVDSITPTIKLTKLGLISNLPDKASLTYYFTSQTPKIEGITEANSTVTFKIGDNTYTTTADSNGNFVINLDNPKLVRGQNVITYSSTDQAGNKSETRTLSLIIGEEYFPEWIYGPVVTEGQNIEEVNQNEKQEEIKKETEDKEFPEVTIYEILVKDTSGKPIANTKVKIGDKFYTTNQEGKISIPITEESVVKYEIAGVLGEFTFNPEKEVNEIVVTLPTETQQDEEKKNFNWLWLLVPATLLLGSGTWYSYNRKKL